MNIDEAVLAQGPLAAPEEAPGTLRQHEPAFLAVVSLVIGVLCVTGAAAFLKLQPPTDRSMARCYTAEHLGEGNTFPGTSVSVSGPPGTRAQLENALAHCSSLWREGFLGPGSGLLRPDPADPPVDIRSLPTLVACTLTDGTAAVFPGDASTCGRLGQATPPR